LLSNRSQARLNTDKRGLLGKVRLPVLEFEVSFSRVIVIRFRFSLIYIKQTSTIFKDVSNKPVLTLFMVAQKMPNQQNIPSVF